MSANANHGAGLLLGLKSILLSQSEWLLPVAILLFVVICTFLFHLQQKSEDFDASVGTNRNITLHITHLLLSLDDAETGQRGFLLTGGREEYLKPFYYGAAQARKEASLLLQATIDRPEQHTRAEAIKVLTDKKIAEVDLTIRLFRTKGSAAALKEVETNSGQQTMEKIRELYAQIETPEHVQWIVNLSETEKYRRESLVFTLAGGACVLVLLILAQVVLRSANSQRERNLLELRKQAFILDQANDTILMRDTQDRITYWNKGAETLYGWSKGEALGQVTHTLLKTQFPQPLADIHAQLLAQGHWEGELKHTRSDGAEIIVASNWTLQRDNADRTHSVLAVNYDITARKAAQERLRRQAFMLDQANDAILIRDNEDRITYWNQGAQRLYGWSTEEVLGQITHTLLKTQFQQSLADIQAELLAQGYWKGELTHTRRDGSLVTVASNWTLQRDDSNRLASVLELNQDITARKEAELQLEKNRREVVARSIQLQAINKELEEFAYAASHDLKAPLRAIDNASKWLEEDLQEHLTGETRENMNSLRGRVRRMEKLLDDLLEYARIGRATDCRYAESISGDELVHDVLLLLSPQNFTVRVSPNFARIQLRRMPLQQILINLIGNAIKHHDKKTGCIDVTLDDNGDCYAFAVRDDGPGIPAQFHDQIFKMFQTLKPRDQVEGSGMGLAMVRKTIEVFGGSLQLESVEGQGSIFRFTWPKQQQMRSAAA